MPRLHQLLQSLGPPPPEICLEWAWQIEHSCFGQLDQPLQWSQLELSSAGEIRQVPIEPADPGCQPLPASTRAEDLIFELLSWSNVQPTAAQVETPTESSDRSYDRQGQLRYRTLQLSAAKETTSSIAPTGADAAHTTLPGSSTSLGKLLVPNRIHAATGRRARAIHLTRRQRVAIAVAISGALAGMLLGAAHWQSQMKRNQSLSPPSATSPLKSETSQLATNQGALAENQGVLAENQGVLADATILPEEESSARYPLSLANVSSTIDSEFPSMTIRDNTEPSVIGSLELGPPTIGSDVDEDALGSDLRLFEQAATSTLAMEIAAEKNRLERSETENVNLIFELDSLANSLPAAEHENQLSAAVASNSTAEPLSIALFPMSQTYKLSSSDTPLPKKPIWHVRLEAGEDYMVSPAIAQRISARETAQWAITAADSHQPSSTQIIVQARLLHPRSATLRWSIAATAADVPQVLVPLNHEILDTLQVRCRELLRGMEFTMEQLRLTSKTSGLPRDLRTFVSEQRQSIEAQLKLGNRILEIVADAHQLQDRLDGQFEVHAELTEQDQADSTPLLQFGTLTMDDGETTTSALPRQGRGADDATTQSGRFAEPTDSMMPKQD